MPVIDVWGAIADPDMPDDVLLRLLARRQARQEGRDLDPCPEADKPHLARHVVVQCGHGELIRPHGDGWEHLSDNQPCTPSTATNTEEKTAQ